MNAIVASVKAAESRLFSLFGRAQRSFTGDFGDSSGAQLLRSLLRVAALATAVTAAIYLVVVAAVDTLAVNNLYVELDQHLHDRLTQIEQRGPRELFRTMPDASNGVQTPIFAWLADRNAQVVASSPTAPGLPSGLAKVTAPETADVGGTQMRVLGVVVDQQGDRVIVGESVASIDQALRALVTSELVAAVPLLLLVFGAAFLVGWRSVGPVERARRRQLAFTADASHELRTPLSVIEAETSLTLQGTREAGAYRDAVVRISRETARLRKIVDDLLWLARFDAMPQPPRFELVDVEILANTSVARFQPVAQAKSIRLSAEVADQASLVEAPSEWMERLVGVLVDNACRYTPDGGEVALRVENVEGRARLVVEDTGPGIPAAERERIFERFHRANSASGGAGLGLAIADAVVSATRGRWEVGDSIRGGARFEVSWPAVRAKRVAQVRQEEALALDAS